uniref:Uncharacterized protein n=1 Tax=Glycine max TaxID=3847 RepID=I1KWD5_SOYBN
MKSEIDHLGAQIKLVTLPHGLDPEDDRSDQPKVILSLKSTMPTKLHELILDINNNNALDADNNNKITCLVVSKNIGWALEVAHKLGIKGALLWPASATSLASFESIRLIDEGIIDSQTAFRYYCWRSRDTWQHAGHFAIAIDETGTLAILQYILPLRIAKYFRNMES